MSDSRGSELGVLGLAGFTCRPNHRTYQVGRWSKLLLSPRSVGARNSWDGLLGWILITNYDGSKKCSAATTFQIIWASTRRASQITHPLGWVVLAAMAFAGSEMRPKSPESLHRNPVSLTSNTPRPCDMKYTLLASTISKGMFKIGAGALEFSSGNGLLDCELRIRSCSQQPLGNSHQCILRLYIDAT